VSASEFECDSERSGSSAARLSLDALPSYTAVIHPLMIDQSNANAFACYGGESALSRVLTQEAANQEESSNKDAPCLMMHLCPRTPSSSHSTALPCVRDNDPYLILRVKRRRTQPNSSSSSIARQTGGRFVAQQHESSHLEQPRSEQVHAKRQREETENAPADEESAEKQAQRETQEKPAAAAAESTIAVPPAPLEMSVVGLVSHTYRCEGLADFVASVIPPLFSDVVPNPDQLRMPHTAPEPSMRGGDRTLSLAARMLQEVPLVVPPAAFARRKKHNNHLPDRFPFKDDTSKSHQQRLLLQQQRNDCRMQHRFASTDPVPSAPSPVLVHTPDLAPLIDILEQLLARQPIWNKTVLVYKVQREAQKKLDALLRADPTSSAVGLDATVTATATAAAAAAAAVCHCSRNQAQGSRHRIFPVEEFEDGRFFRVQR